MTVCRNTGCVSENRHFSGNQPISTLHSSIEWLIPNYSQSNWTAITYLFENDFFSVNGNETIRRRARTNNRSSARRSCLLSPKYIFHFWLQKNRAKSARPFKCLKKDSLFTDSSQNYRTFTSEIALLFLRIARNMMFQKGYFGSKSRVTHQNCL